MSIDLYTHWKLRSIFFMQIYIIEYLLGTSQANEYRASKKKMWIARTSIFEKTLYCKNIA